MHLGTNPFNGLILYHNIHSYARGGGVQANSPDTDGKCAHWQFVAADVDKLADFTLPSCKIDRGHVLSVNAHVHKRAVVFQTEIAMRDIPEAGGSVRNNAVRPVVPAFPVVARDVRAASPTAPPSR